MAEDAFKYRVQVSAWLLSILFWVVVIMVVRRLLGG